MTIAPVTKTAPKTLMDFVREAEKITSGRMIYIGINGAIVLCPNGLEMVLPGPACRGWRKDCTIAIAGLRNNWPRR